uniref:Uncharacterized protein n=1 Tax=Magallana gigas TaxID=29159 RepID=A0A8W8NVR8_MAGGI
MALYRSPKQRFARFIFAITSLVLGIEENCYARTTTEVYSAKVDVCPQNQTEWQEASRRLNCSDDAKSPVNKYHCLPVHNLTSLLEFCYSGHRPQVVKGLCLTYVQEINNLDSYNCTTFDDGCPDTLYHSDETYKFPKCTEIDPFNLCYVADSSCRKNTTVNETSTSKTTQKSTDNKIAIFVSTSVVLSLGAVICIVTTVVIKRRKCNSIKGKGLIECCVTVKARKGVEMPLLNVANITRLGLNYLLERLPTDEESILEIAKTLNVPPEIVRWSKDNKQRFVKSMEKGTKPVYNGRGMVIGCAEAGKTTLVKKLKGENNLSTTSTTSTIGIDIHVHEFKLDAEECTIISK